MKILPFPSGLILSPPTPPPTYHLFPPLPDDEDCHTFQPPISPPPPPLPALSPPLPNDKDVAPTALPTPPHLPAIEMAVAACR